MQVKLAQTLLKCMQLLNAKPVYRVPELRREFSIGRSVLYLEIKADRLCTFKIGGGTGIAGIDALQWLESLREAT
jgi:predicted DNA-binding transcriptional regulator YafY